MRLEPLLFFGVFDCVVVFGGDGIVRCVWCFSFGGERSGGLFRGVVFRCGCRDGQVSVRVFDVGRVFDRRDQWRGVVGDLDLPV